MDLTTATSRLGMRGRVALIACVIACLLTSTASAQEPPSEQPTPAQIEAARLALQRERAERDLELSDAWMKRVMNDELAFLKLEPITIAYLGLIAVGWGVGAVANAESGGRRSETVALVAASVASAGMLTASLLAGDRYARRKAENISILLEGVMAGTAELVLAGHARCRHDCEVLFTSVGVAILATTASALLMELLLPQVWASQQDEHYRSLSGSARVTFARDLLLRRDDVARKRLYCNWALSLASAAIFAAAIPLANGTPTRIELGVLAGAMLLTSSIGLILGLVERNPSDQLMQGVLPPPD